YQPLQAPLHISNVKALFQPGSKAASDAKIEGSSNWDLVREATAVDQVKIGGHRYEAYAQPVHLRAMPEMSDGNEWVILAFVRPSRVFKRAVYFSYPLLAGALGT